MRSYVPGLSLAVGVGALAWVVSAFAPTLGAVTLAIVFGAVLANTKAPPDDCEPGIQFAEKYLLEGAVVLLGLQIDGAALLALEPTSVLLIAGLVAGTIGAGLAVGKLFGLSSSLGLLLGIGNAICGTSAIAAAAPMLDEKEGEAAVAIGVINALGTVGIVAVPALAVALGMGEQQSALLIGGTLQAVGHVVAAGFSVGEGVGELATAVKMGRVALLVPVVLLLGLLRARQQADGARVPPFLIGFAVAAAVGAGGLLPASVLGVADGITDAMLVVAMAAVGSRIQLSSLVAQGMPAIGVGLLVFVLQVGVLAALLSL